MQKAALMTATLALMAGAVLPHAAAAQDSNSQEESKKSNDNTAAIVAGIAVLGMGLAIATSKHGDDYRHDSEWDGNLYGNPFSPAKGVTCVPRQQTCYDRGNYSYNWTRRIFGSSGNNWGGSGGGNWGGSGSSSSNLDRARRVCLDRARDRGIRNPYVESVRPHNSSTARVYLETRSGPSKIAPERWRCEYRYSNGRTEFDRI